MIDLCERLINYIQESAPAVKESFARKALVLCLKRLGELKSSVAWELLQRDYEDWYCHILDGSTRLFWRPLPSYILLSNTREEIELEVGSLLHELLIISGAEVTNPYKNRFNPGLTNLTPLDTLILYGHAFEVETPNPRLFGTSDLPALQRALSRSRIFVKVTKQNEICRTAVSDIGNRISLLVEPLPLALPDLVKVLYP